MEGEGGEGEGEHPLVQYPPLAPRVRPPLKPSPRPHPGHPPPPSTTAQVCHAPHPEVFVSAARRHCVVPRTRAQEMGGLNLHSGCGCLTQHCCPGSGHRQAVSTCQWRGQPAPGQLAKCRALGAQDPPSPPRVVPPLLELAPSNSLIALTGTRPPSSGLGPEVPPHGWCVL
ncbi:hypothetical protein DMC30DRAFT_391602 [Rhodotorula diobovata]|uniref:Uncharacterized protein n=1 Tax=Rhodotorula diobovata TaxID=5288 RepID=A0A5C5G0J1_9BASI|nr:hypothetical protein DMC30DRAFT_391602 [Rhodotorula diobovata]